jgi:hypothetical protein
MTHVFMLVAQYAAALWQTGVVLMRARRWCRKQGIPFLATRGRDGLSVYSELVHKRWHNIQLIRYQRIKERSHAS